ncbi:MAG TPA: site-2 protease family protein [Nitrospirae bacterium]|nr:site-2 protease family protein [Nitrospirota bacterium]
MDFSDTIRQLIVSAVPILIAITFHEVAHGLVANRLGDPTARQMGRLTLNPLAHIDLVGTIILPAILIITGAPVFGWAKPVPINPHNFRDPRRDMAISAAAGPVTNLLLAILSLLILKFLIIPTAGFLPDSLTIPLTMMFRQSILINIILAAFNLLPIPPLDGGRVLTGFLPHQQAVAFSKIEPYGFFIVIILLMTGIAGIFINPIIRLMLALLSLF